MVPEGCPPGWPSRSPGPGPRCPAGRAAIPRPGQLQHPSLAGDGHLALVHHPGEHLLPLVPGGEGHPVPRPGGVVPVPGAPQPEAVTGHPGGVLQPPGQQVGQGPARPSPVRHIAPSPHPDLLSHHDQVGVLDLGVQGDELLQGQAVGPGQGPQGCPPSPPGDRPAPRAAVPPPAPASPWTPASPRSPGRPGRCTSCRPPRRRRSSAHSRAGAPAPAAGRRNRRWPACHRGWTSRPGPPL